MPLENYSSEIDLDGGYRIGAVAKLTGISTDTIRAWERRYKVVVPNRGENNNRYYTESHVKKLLSIKRLVDAGQAIGSICRLTDEELDRRTSGLFGIERKVQDVGKNWIVFSRQRPDWLQACVENQNNDSVTWVTELSEISSEYDFVVIDMPSLSETSEQEILHAVSPAPGKYLIVYKFAARSQLRNLSEHGFKLLKGPLEPYALVNLLGKSSATQAQGDPTGASCASTRSDRCDPAAELIGLIHEFEGRLLDCSVQGQLSETQRTELCNEVKVATRRLKDSLEEIVG